MSYATPLDRYVAPARARPQLWRLLLGLVVVLIVWVAVTAGFFWAAAHVMPVVRSGGLDRQMLMDWLMGSPQGVLLALATLSGILFGVWAAVRLLHGRGIGSVMGRGARVVRDFLTVAGIMLVLALVVSLLTTDMSALEPGLPFAEWLKWLPLTLLAVGVQTLSEETLFRGYLLQQMAARFGGRWAWMFLPALVFAALHGGNPGVAGQAFLPTMAVLFLFAVAAADLTAVTGSLGAAWGFHFANNLTVVAFVSSGDMLSGLSLWHGGGGTGGGPAPPPGLVELAGNGLLILVVWMICRRVLRR